MEDVKVKLLHIEESFSEQAVTCARRSIQAFGSAIFCFLFAFISLFLQYKMEIPESLSIVLALLGIAFMILYSTMTYQSYYYILESDKARHTRYNTYV